MQRLRVLSLNVGALSTLLWQELREALPGLPHDVVFLQETHWSEASQFAVNQWTVVQSSTAERADGVMVLLSPRFRGAVVRHEEVVPGRVLRVQIQLQDSWSSSTSTSSRITSQCA